MTDLKFLDDLRDLVQRAEEDERFLSQLVNDVEELIQEYDEEDEI